MRKEKKVVAYNLHNVMLLDHFTDEPAIPEDTIAPTFITECKQSTDIETPTPPPEEDQGEFPS